MNYLEEYYSNYDEEGRLLVRHGQVEYITTMTYIHRYLEERKAQREPLQLRILEVGAGDRAVQPGPGWGRLSGGCPGTHGAQSGDSLQQDYGADADYSRTGQCARFVPV